MVVTLPEEETFVNRRHLTLLVAVALTVALTGCGTDKTTTSVSGAPGTTAAAAGKPAPEAAPLLAAVASKTDAEKTAKMTITVGVDAVGLPDSPTGPVTVSGQGAFDYVTKQGTLHFDVSGMTAGSAATSLDMIIDGDAAYVKLPDSMLSSTGGKHWAKVGTDSGSGGLSIDLSQIQQFSDPNFFLQFLKGVSEGDITMVGHDTLHGDDTSHYHVSIDPTKAAGGSGSAGGFDVGMMTGGMPMPADVWVDDQGRLRQFALSLDMTMFLKAMIEGFGGLDASSSSAAETVPASTLPADFRFAMTMQLEMWDFGSPVTVTTPDPSDVAEGVSIPGLGGTDAPPTS